jgi:hypothetical protein
MPREDVADHRCIPISACGNHQNLTAFDHVQRLQNGADIRRLALHSDSRAEETRLQPGRAQRA